MEKKKIKLHLGCGEVYLDGYTNIDFPPDNRKAQKKAIADVFVDIRNVKYKRNEVSEIRNHHFFEHFTRAQACALLASWNSWLVMSGKLRIEVPDGLRCMKVITKKNESFRNKMVAQRHLMGSQEAPWALHYVAYSTETLTNLLNIFGFKLIDINEVAWRKECKQESNKIHRYMERFNRFVNRASGEYLYNIEITGIKKNNITSKEEAERLAVKYLENFKVNNTDTENRIMKTWIEDFQIQMDKSFTNTK